MSASDPTAGTAPGGEALARTLVLNALRDLCGGPAVLADDASRDLLRERFESAVSADRRERFRDVAVTLDRDPTDEESTTLTETAADVLAALGDDGVRATLVHRAPLSVPAREAHLYSFLVGRDPAALTDLDLPEAVRERVETGAAALTDGDAQTAADRFEEAVAESGAGGGAVATRVLAADAHHRAGADDAAIDYVEEALHLDTGAWTAKLVGHAADARRPAKFRDGKLGARAFFRWTTEIPEDGSVTVGVGPTDGDVRPLAGRPECMPLDRLWPETTVEVRVRGDLPVMPTVQAYYLALGVVDLEVSEARSVEQMLLSGPAGAGATERVRFERPPDRS